MKVKMAVKMITLALCICLMSAAVIGEIYAANAGASSGVQALPEITLKYSSITTKGSSTERYYVMSFKNWIERETKGKLQLKYFDPGVLAQATEVFDAVSAGMLDVAMGIGSYSAKIPEGALETGLPFLRLSLNELFDLYTQHGIVDLLRETYAKFNIYYVTSVPSMEYKLFTKAPVTSLDDLKGKKIRATGFLAKALDAVGATSVSLAGSEIYMAAQRGVVDGIAYPLWSLESYKYKEVTNYILLDNLGPTICNFIVNMNTWQKLPEQYKEVIHQAAVHATLLGIVGITAEDEIAKLKAEQYGLKTTTLTDAARNKWIEEARKLWKEYAVSKGEHVVKELKIIEDYLQKKGQLK
jgi:TRAP-type C4-dicarboxylate transport system substrate-binding protein